MLSGCCIKLHLAAGCGLAGPWMLTRPALCLTLTQALRIVWPDRSALHSLSIHDKQCSYVLKRRTLRIWQPAQ